MAISLKNITKAFNGKLILKDVSLPIYTGKIQTILGPSGCGKSTLLNIINKTLSADGGTCSISEETISQVFQEPRLLPWKTVRDNVLYVMKDKTGDSLKRLDEMLLLVGLDDASNQYPHQLSGGMQQRCALVRAFAINASTVILDEPFKGLDQKTKSKMIELVINLWHHQNNTVIFVTHDVNEALRLSHYITLLSALPGSVIYNTAISSGLKERDLKSEQMKLLKIELTSLINR